jgi:hypothetical protein
VTEIKKTTKCAHCGTETSCKNSICVLCKTGITQIYDELMDSLKSDKNWNLPHALKKKKAG